MIASGELFEVIGEMEYDKFKRDVFYIRVTYPSWVWNGLPVNVAGAKHHMIFTQ